MRIVVVGAGISGLSCAWLLVQAGHEVVVVSADPLPRTTSYLAAAVWFPTAVGPPAAVARWGAASYDILAAQAAAGLPGVRMRETLVLHRHAAALPPSPPAWAGAVGQIRPARPHELPPGYARGLRFVAPLVEMPVYLPYLWRAVLAAGARSVARRVADLEQVLDLDPEVVVNAAGLAAGELVGDDSVFPIRGQIVRVTNPGLELSVRDEAHPDGRAYVHPRSTDCILGGTLDVGNRDTSPDDAETTAILKRCTDIAPQLTACRVLETAVGVRPGRPEVRVALDHDVLSVPVIHDYGHGGAGITVGWGCAHDVAALVDQLAGRQRSARETSTRASGSRGTSISGPRR